jgi:hypothetical protein
MLCGCVGQESPCSEAYWLLLVSESRAQTIASGSTFRFPRRKLDGQSDFAFALNPFYLRGDFNGDGKPDVAILVKNKTSGKLGIAICHNGKNEIFLIGAGTPIGNAGDDFSWMDALPVYPRSCAEKGRAANGFGEAVQVEKSESGGRLICWDGKKYIWQQHGE